MLDDVKVYLRVDHSYEDDLIESLIKAAISYIKRGTGVTITADNDKGMLALKLLVGHWYENREVVGRSESLPHSLTALLLQLESERENES